MGGQEYNSRTDQISPLAPGLASQIETAATASGGGAVTMSSSASIDRTCLLRFSDSRWQLKISQFVLFQTRAALCCSGFFI
jgi:hypothetical protein